VLSEVQGQDEAVRFLRRVVEDHFTDPLLLVGEEGTGRRFSAVQAIKEVFCLLDRSPSCRCGGCLQVDRGCHPDFNFIAAGAEKIKVDTIRDMLEMSWDAPSVSTRRFIMIDGADRMTNEAANALLKTLEEPAPSTRFLLLSESYDHVLPTIRSRCGKISYRPLADSFVLSVVQRFEKDPVKASIYARMGEGSVGRSVSYAGVGKLALRDRVLDLLQLGLAGDFASLFSIIDKINTDAELPLALRFVEQLLHDILMVTIAPDRMINLDQCETIQKLRNKTKLVVWTKLCEGARAVVNQSRWTPINLSFHVKELFASFAAA
jgi:DNA polymerase III subunit delta'